MKFLHGFYYCAIILWTALNSPAQTTVTLIAAGREHGLFVKSDGSLWGMGLNEHYALGDATTNAVFTPELIVSNGVTAIAAANYRSFYVQSGLWAMGDNDEGELGDGTINDAPVPELIKSGRITAISAGIVHTVFIRKPNFNLTQFWDMGYNVQGALGDGTYNNQLSPDNVFSYLSPEVGSPVTVIAAGSDYTMFVKGDGSLWATGNNVFGNFGDGSTTARNTPEEILTSGVQSVAAGYYTTLVMKTDGSLWACGNDDHGQLGDGQTAAQSSLQQVVSGGVTAISASEWHGLYLTTGGALWGMGDDGSGELGLGTHLSQNTPHQIVDADVTAVSTGDYFTMFLLADGSLWGMGDNENGELGQGPSGLANYYVPVQIVGPLVANGGFEAGLIGWNSNAPFKASVGIATTNSAFVHGGARGALMRQASLTQTINAPAGTNYLLSFWLDVSFVAVPSGFSVSWNGTTLLTMSNLTSLTWTNFQFSVPGAGPGTVLEFDLGDGGYGIDDVSVVLDVQPGITGVSFSGTDLVLSGTNGLAGTSYETLMTTDLGLPLSQWSVVASNMLGANGNFSITATNAMDPTVPKRLFIIRSP